MFHRKDAAEAAAFLGMGQVHDLRASHICQECPRLAVDLHAAREMTGWMIGERPVPLRAHVGDVETVHEIFGEFVDAFPQCLCAWQPSGIVGEEFGIIVLDHMRTRTGGHHDVAGRAFEDADGVRRDLARFLAQACVEVGLSAAGLVGGEVHIHAEAAENIHDRLACLRVERIDEAGDEKLDAGHETIVIRFQVTTSSNES